MLEITRHFNGMSITITLNNKELREAYEMQQQLYDEADVREMLTFLRDEEIDYPESFLNDMKDSTDFMDDAVSYYRDNYSCDQPEYDQRESAVEVTLRKHYPDWLAAQQKEEAGC